MQDVEPGRPVRSQLASAAKSPEEAFRRMKNKTFVVETKFDGQHCLDLLPGHLPGIFWCILQEFHTPSVGCGVCNQTLQDFNTVTHHNNSATWLSTHQGMSGDAELIGTMRRG